MNDNTLMTAMAEVMERSKALRVEAQNQKGYLDTLLRHTKVERSLSPTITLLGSKQPYSPYIYSLIYSY